MVIFTSIPKRAQTLFGNGLVTEPYPFGNRDRFNGDPHIEMGIHSICFPIWKWGSKERLHFHMGMCLSPFPYDGNHHMETRSRVIGLPIWKRGFTLSIWGCVYPCFHMVIAMWKRGAVSLCSLWKWGFPYRNGVEIGISISIW